MVVMMLMMMTTIIDKGDGGDDADDGYYGGDGYGIHTYMHAYITFHYITLHYIQFHSITLHYIHTYILSKYVYVAMVHHWTQTKHMNSCNIKWTNGSNSLCKLLLDMVDKSAAILFFSIPMTCNGMQP